MLIAVIAWSVSSSKHWLWQRWLHRSTAHSGGCPGVFGSEWVRSGFNMIMLFIHLQCSGWEFSYFCPLGTSCKTFWAEVAPWSTIQRYDSVWSFYFGWRCHCFLVSCGNLTGSPFPSIGCFPPEPVVSLALDTCWNFRFSVHARSWKLQPVLRRPAKLVPTHPE